jgi:DnaJ-class molecular chaperone
MADIDPVFAIESQTLAEIIDQLDYFQILKVDQSAAPAALKVGYFRESRLYHPDQFYMLAPSPAKDAISLIYKRVNEAWVVLRDDAKRAKYLADINGPERDKKLRYTEASEEELKKQRDAELGTTPQGRKTFAQGLRDLEAGRYPQALLNLRLAVQFEPQNTLFKQKRDEAARLAGAKP